jgi:autotransporter family porin
MNKTHRLVWSESRQTYIVTHEKAATHGKPASTRKAVLAQAVTCALLALSVANEAQATSGDNICYTAPPVDNTPQSQSIPRVTHAINGSATDYCTFIAGASNDTTLSIASGALLQGGTASSSSVGNSGNVAGAARVACGNVGPDPERQQHPHERRTGAGVEKGA